MDEDGPEVGGKLACIHILACLSSNSSRIQQKATRICQPPLILQLTSLLLGRWGAIAYN